MEHLLMDFKIKLSAQRMLEAENVLKLDKEKDRDIILITSGKIFGFDQVLEMLEKMLNYHNQLNNSRE
jgi:hypothetical protein